MWILSHQGQGLRLRSRGGNEWDRVSLGQAGQEQEGQKARFLSKPLKKCQRSNGRQVQVSRPKGKWRAVRGRGPRWPWNGVGSGWPRSQGPGGPAQDSRDPAVSMKAQGQDRHLVHGYRAFLMFLETKVHKAAQGPGRGALAGRSTSPSLLCPVAVLQTKFPSISCT